MSQYTPIKDYNMHVEKLSYTKDGNYACPTCGAELTHSDSLEDSEGYRIEWWCPKCHKPVTQLFEMIPKGFFYSSPIIRTLDPKTSTIADLQEFLRQAGKLASANTPEENDLISESMDGYATSFLSELVDKAVDLSTKLK